MAEPHYLEECCWDWIRDQCRNDGRCACRYHSEETRDTGPQPDEMVRMQQAIDAAEGEIDRLNRLVETLSRALDRYQQEEVRDRTQGSHPFIPLSGSQGTDGQYTRCSVMGCALKRIEHPGEW